MLCWMCPSLAIAAVTGWTGRRVLPAGSGVVVGGGGGGSVVVFTGSETRREGSGRGWMVPVDAGDRGGGPGSPLQARTTCSVQFTGVQRHPATLAADPWHHSGDARSSFPPAAMSWKDPAMGGPQPNRWQTPSAPATLTLSRHTRLHRPIHFTSSIPVQRQPPPVSCRLGSAGKPRGVRGFSFPFFPFFPPWGLEKPSPERCRGQACRPTPACPRGKAGQEGNRASGWGGSGVRGFRGARAPWG